MRSGLICAVEKVFVLLARWRDPFSCEVLSGSADDERFSDACPLDRMIKSRRPHGLPAAIDVTRARCRSGGSDQFGPSSCISLTSHGDAAETRGLRRLEGRKRLIEERGRSPVGLQSAHVSANDIEQFGQDIEAAVAEKCADWRSLTRPNGRCPPLLIPAGAESQHLKTTPAPPNAALGLENRARA